MPATRTSRPPAPRRKPAVKVTSPTVDERLWPFELGGVVYHAWMPKDYVFMQLAAAFSPEGEPEDLMVAIPLFVKSCLPPDVRRTINARMKKRPSEDKATATEMYLRLGELIEQWTEPMAEAMRVSAAQIKTAGKR